MIKSIRRIQDIFTKRGEKELLVVESNGLVIHAAVIKKNENGKCVIKCCIKSRELDLADALKEIMVGIRKSSLKAPTQAVLLDSHVFSTILQLPVDPRKPLIYKEMQELIRWELEPYITQRRLRRLGSVLVGRGYIKEKDVDRIITIIESEKDGNIATPGAKKIPLFGEVAQRIGLISRDQLEESLILQQPSHYNEGEPVSGWTSLSKKPLNGRWPWLVCGLPVTYRDYAVKSFEDQKLTLYAIYPNVGMAGANLDRQSISTSGVFEFQSGSLSYTRLKDGNIINTRFNFISDLDNLVQSCMEFIEKDVEDVWIAGRWPDIEKAAHNISIGTERSCHKLSVETELSIMDENSLSEYMGMTGAFRHFVRLASAESGVYVSARVPSTPLTQHKYFRYGVVLAIIAVLFNTLGVMHQSKRSFQSEIVQEVRAKEKIMADINTLRKQLMSLNKKKSFLNEELPRRKELLPELLYIFQSAIPKDIMLNKFYEDNAGLIHIEGWGLSVRSIQIFKLDISERLTGMRLDSKGYPVQQKKGWKQSDGYSFKFDLISESKSKSKKAPMLARKAP